METETAPARKPRMQWHTVSICGIIDETPRVRTLLLDIPSWPGHRAGQHVDLRLTAEDGYQARRSYSIASAPEDEHVAITLERLDDGEVSSYLGGEARLGDQFELRGPIGGSFVWTSEMDEPLFLVAGGSGIVPLMSMLRHRAASGNTVPTTLLYSSRSFGDIIYREELDALVARDDGLKVVHTLTREQPAGWQGGARRIDPAMLAETAFPNQQSPRIFICGSTQLVEIASRSMMDLGHRPEIIKTERFGPAN